LLRIIHVFISNKRHLNDLPTVHRHLRYTMIERKRLNLLTLENVQTPVVLLVISFATEVLVVTEIECDHVEEVSTLVC